MAFTKEPLYPLIEYPEGLDADDYYCRIRIDMVTVHVRGLELVPLMRCRIGCLEA